MKTRSIAFALPENNPARTGLIALQSMGISTIASERGRRCAAGTNANLARPHICCGMKRYVGLFEKNRKLCVCPNQRVRRRRESESEARETGTGCRRGEGWRGADCPLQCGHHVLAHGAVMRTMAPAAGRQAGVAAGLKQTLQRAEGEEQHHQDREGTPHLTRCYTFSAHYAAFRVRMCTRV